MISAREAALLTLNDIFYNGAYSNLAVKEMLSKCRGMDKNEKAFYTGLVYGVVSRHFTLEYVILKYSSIKLKKLARYVKIILEMGIYQLLYFDKVPQSAAVNESVKLAKKYCKKGSDRFVNAILRAFCKDNCSVEYPDDNLAAKYSFSHEMTDLFVGQFGYEFSEQLMDALNLAPEFLLRPNVLKTDAKTLSKLLAKDGINNAVTDYGMINTDGFDVGASELYLDGFFTVQDRGAYSASVALDPKPGETVIDMCAAPGGKTTHIAELMNDNGRIIAFDIHEHKISLINNAAKRLGIKSIEAQTADSSQLLPQFKGGADRVLCDVPCSGWGIIRRKPDIKLSHTDLSELYRTQRKILQNGAEYVKKGGCLVYSTCTVNKHENEEIISEFLRDNNEFEKVYEKTYYPHIDGCDGFFICRLNKK